MGHLAMMQRHITSLSRITFRLEMESIVFFRDECVTPQDEQRPFKPQLVADLRETEALFYRQAIRTDEP